jgi:hypothetical protein
LEPLKTTFAKGMGWFFLSITVPLTLVCADDKLETAHNNNKRIFLNMNKKLKKKPSRDFPKWLQI